VPKDYTWVIIPFLILSALIPAFRFTSLRVRDAALPPAERDPQIGRKFAFGLFTHLGLMLVLCGLTYSALDAMWEMTEPLGRSPDFVPLAPPIPKDWWNPLQRLAVGLVASGVLHGGLGWCGLTFLTNHRRFPGVARSFVVLRAVLCGLVLVTANTFALLLFLAEGKTDYRFLSFFLALLVVWGPAMIGHVLWVWRGNARTKPDAVD
jgi:hypothetical protein